MTRDFWESHDRFCDCYHDCYCDPYCDEADSMDHCDWKNLLKNACASTEQRTALAASHKWNKKKN